MSPMRPKPRDNADSATLSKIQALPKPQGGRWFCQNPACLRVVDAAVESRIVAGTAEGRERIVMEEKLETRPLQNVQCPKCGHGRAYFHLMQTRRSDEPPTQINECESCKHSWRDYQ
jgi:transcription factor S